MKQRSLSCLAVTLAALLAPAGGQAAVIVYTTPASYAAATTGNIAYSFPDINGPTVTTYTNGPLTFSSPVLALYASAYGTGIGYLASNSPESISLTGATALSFTLGTYYASESISFRVNGAPVTTLTTPSAHPATVFIGFTDTVPITRLTFIDTAAGGEIDTINFQVGSLAVPEPSTWALLCLGAAGVGVAALRRRRLA